MDYLLSNLEKLTVLKFLLQIIQEIVNYIIGIINNIDNNINNIETSLINIENTIEEITDPSTTFLYYGEKIPSKINGFNSEKILQMSYDGSSLTSQDIETFGGYLFVSFSGIEQIKIYSLATHELLDSIEIEMQHGTGMQFSNDFYDENDEFPLLYVGG